MSSIVSPKATDSQALVAGYGSRGPAIAVASVLLCVLLISLRPFQPAGASEAGGDIVNQIGFATIGATSIAALLMLADRRLVPVLVGPWWLLLLGFIGLAVTNAYDPASAARAAMFTGFGVLAIIAVLCLATDANGFSTVIGIASTTVLLLSYAGLLLFPDAAIHGTNSTAPDQAGLWRGLFSHKNVAGPVMACLGFAGIYLFRRRWRLLGALVFVGALIFVLNSGSKTTVVLVPLTIFVVIVPGLFGLRSMVPFLCLCVFSIAAIATIGTVFFDPVNQLVQSIAPGNTYTGRFTLWQFAAEMVGKEPLTGYGFESFWRSPLVIGSDQPFDREWDIRTVVHGHNGYLDIALSMGIPALVCVMVAFILSPLRDYLRVPRTRENVLIADLFLMMWVFLAISALLESFFLRRADPVWMMFVMALFGLRLTARFTLPTVRDSH